MNHKIKNITSDRKIIYFLPTLIKKMLPLILCKTMKTKIYKTIMLCMVVKCCSFFKHRVQVSEHEGPQGNI